MKMTTRDFTPSSTQNHCLYSCTYDSSSIELVSQVHCEMCVTDSWCGSFDAHSYFSYQRQQLLVLAPVGAARIFNK